MSEPRGWYSRGYLPHIDAGPVPQFITWRLKDSIPQALLLRWEEELERLSKEEAGRQMQSRIESYLDEGHGSATLKLPGAAKIVQDALLYYHELHYSLHAWVVMPTHVHVLITPFEGRDFRAILRPLKGYCSREIHRHYGGQGAFWQRDFFDRMIRDEEHFAKIVAYIEWNPVKAGLCSDPSRFPYSSANPTAIDRVLAKSAEKRSGI